MQRHATFIVTLVAAVAVVVVVPIIGHGSLIAWAVTGVLIVALVVALAMYFAKRRKQPEPPGEINTRPSGPTTVIGDVIGAHDHSIVMDNKVDSKINVFNAPPTQPVPPKDDPEPDSY
jgi:membrane protein implicated in regulation of membrane protease activity